MREGHFLSFSFFALKTIKFFITQITILLAISIQLFAQISIKHPLDKAVYQRNSSNQATIFIHGSLNQGLVSAVQARVVNPISGIALPGFDWASISTSPIGGFYQGQLNNVPAGWHSLEVRSMLGTTVLHSASLSRFGIGDVFLISGQSNGQGWVDNQYIGASLDRVVTHDNGQYCSLNDIPFPVMTQLIGTVKPSPNGYDSWCYGKLGDNIANQTTFPVAFFNAGAAGASVLNFKESSDDINTIHALTNQFFCSQPLENTQNPAYVPLNQSTYASKNPYLFFRKSLNYYNSMFGARAVLWHQGESDNSIGTSTASYQANLNYLINKTRTDFNSNLPWVVARASYFNSVADPNVIAGQNAVINPAAQIYAGPSTDDINNTTIPGSRDALDVHFYGFSSLYEVANRWTAALNPSFFSTSTPVVSNAPPVISISYTNVNNVTLSLPGSYTSYKWIRTDLTGNSNYSNASEGSGFSINKSVGTYRCWVSTANGNQQISPEVNVTQLLNLLGNVGTCSANANISNLNYNQVSNGLGPIEINKTNGAAGDGDGPPIVLKGINYASGIGVSPLSEISYKIPTGQFYRFRSFIGISDDVTGCSNTGGVVYKVYGDGNLIYTSPTIYRNSPLTEINVPIYSFTDLKLRVEAVSANATCNKAVWADARVICLGSDNIPPSTVGVITASDTLTKCISFQWPHATDNTDVKQYNVYKNGIKIDSVLASVNTYTLTGLSRNASVVFGVQAVDLVNNVSAIVTKTISTKDLIVDYGNLDDFVCVSRTYMPILKTPSNGVFTLAASYPGTTIGYTTGAFFSSVVSAPSSAYDFYYTINNSNPGCYDYRGFNLGTIAAPTSTPTITSDKSIINIGTAINLSSSSCSSGTLWWNFTNATTTSVSDSPIINNSYKASCRIAQCHNYSNEITVKVLPNCFSALTLARPIDNLGSNINPLNYNSSNTISSSQQIVPANTIQYSSANSILLQPGFSVSPGVKFIARIQNCPN
jgi:NPCBM/NEW2 domain/Carbohydrate esterase, sialic acid-specific acetylesterase